MQDFLTIAIEFIALSTLALIVAAEAAKARELCHRGTTPPDPVPAPLTVAPVVAKAFPSLAPALTRRQLLRIAKQLRVRNYSRLDTERLREAVTLACA